MVVLGSALSYECMVENERLDAIDGSAGPCRLLPAVPASKSKSPSLFISDVTHLQSSLWAPLRCVQ